MKIIEGIKASGSSLTKAVAEGQGALFDETEMEKSNSSSAPRIDMDAIDEAPKEEILSWERELLGLYLTEHPLAKFAARLSQVSSSQISDLESLTSHSKSVRLGGIISAVRTTLTKVRQEEMCFLKLQDLTGTIEVIVFPRVFKESRHLIAADKIVLVSGKLETDEAPILIAEKITTIDEDQEAELPIEDYLEISIPKNADRILLSKIYEAIKANPGQEKIYLILPQGNGSSRKFSVPFGTSRNRDLEESLAHLGCKIIN